MITIKQLTEKLQEDLNANQLGLTFCLFSNTGKFKKALKVNNKVTDYINGVVVNTSSEITNTNDGMVVGTMTNRIEIAVRCKDFEEDILDSSKKLVAIGNDTFMTQIREFFDAFTSQSQFFQLEDVKKRCFDVSVGFTFASPGVRNQVQFLGDSMTFIIYAYYTLVEAGENSRSYEVYLDGDRVPYSAITPRRAPTHEQDTYVNSNGVALATVSNTVWSLSMECPSFIGVFSKVIKNYIEKGERNVAHLLRLKLGTGDNAVESAHLVFFGEGVITAQGVLNAGQRISFMDAVNDYDLISFSDKVYIYYNSNSSNKSATLKFGETAVVYNSKDGTIKLTKDNELYLSLGRYIVTDKPILSPLPENVTLRQSRTE